MRGLDERLQQAVRHFWVTRESQESRQGLAVGRQDQGARRAVTGGAQLNGFIELVRELLIESGIEDRAIHVRQRAVLPGFFRPTKEWDLIVSVDGNLVASIEFKSQIGSLGNNFNNRTEEALGSATDLWTAFREGAFKDSIRPWLGYFMLLEDSPASRRAINGILEPLFPVFEEFRGASYMRRYELLCEKLIRERLYDAACLILSDKIYGPDGRFHEPSLSLSFKNFAASLTGQIVAYIGRNA